jgi:hypothetical protein
VIVCVCVCVCVTNDFRGVIGGQKKESK